MDDMEESWHSRYHRPKRLQQVHVDSNPPAETTNSGRLSDGSNRRLPAEAVITSSASIPKMVRHIRNQRHGIVITTEAGELRLLGIAYLATALHRSRWTALYWERIGLLPPAAFIINADRQNVRRRLYPDVYIRELNRITVSHYPAPRLDYELWPQFQKEVRDAYHRTVAPHLGNATLPVEVATASMHPS
jgi:hypothetical protein